MNDPTLDEAISMVQAVNSLHDNTASFFNESGHQPSPNSKAALELRTFQRPESVATAFSQGAVLIEVAADQLMAFIKTVSQPAQSIAPWTCTRALIESAALAAWLLDPTLDIRTRVQRSFAFRYEGLSQQVKYAHAARINADLASQRIDQVEGVALGLGFSRVENRQRERIGIAQQMPSITDLVNQTLDEKKTYRLLSAVAHAHPWALQQLSFQRIYGESLQFPDSITDGENAHPMEKSLSTLSVAFLCLKSAYVFARPVWFRCLLLGWDSERLRSILNNAFDSFGSQQPKRRFWE